MFAMVDRMLARAIRSGDLTVVDAEGRTHRYGDGTGEPVSIRFRDQATEWRLTRNPEFQLGESYMDGGLAVTRGDVRQFLKIIFANAELNGMPAIVAALYRLRGLFRPLQQYNPIGKAKANVAHHYDLSGALYDLFLDPDRQYSCAYYERPGISLAEAQLAKKRHIAAKLALKPGMKVLDIGSGWGGLGLYLAAHCGADVTGVTLSEEQHRLSNERARQAGLAGRVRFLLQDYRELDQSFDRIVSVGMFEHVGIGHFREFFSAAHRLLADDGVMLLHSINRAHGPGATSKWIAKYIFPGGHLPALSEVIPAIEKAGLTVTDVEILRLHYAETLKHWYEAFQTRRREAAALYDERFCRMWEFYLASSEMSFRHGGLNNFQIQMVKRQTALPLTRNYMGDMEANLRQHDGGTSAPLGTQT